MESKNNQILTSFPNANDKHIDYVLVYRRFPDEENNRFKKKCLENRQKFFERLENETIEVYDIEMKNEKDEFVYALLHCSTERLLKEAEYINLEMKLKSLKDNLGEVPVEIEQKGVKKLTENLKRPLKDDGTGVINSYRYDLTIRFVFEGVDDAAKPKGPFNNTIRMLLVDSILNNLVYKKSKNSYVNQGLSYMLDNQYIDDSFILHDQTTDRKHLASFFSIVNQTAENEDLSKHFIENYVKTINEYKDKDTRRFLNENWAKFRNFYRFQPMWNIRNYFGEEYSLYFAWMGVFLISLFIIAIFGLGFCLVGILVVNTASFSTLGSTLTNSSTSLAVDSIMKSTFDNNITPLFAICLCIWGIIFVEYWKRENTRLAYEWDVQNFEKFEADMPEYRRKQIELKEYLSNKGRLGRFLFFNMDPIKKIISFVIIALMLGLVCLEIGALVLYRIYFTVTVFPNNKTYQLLVADIGSTVINTIFIMIVQFVYTKLAKKLTRWENHKTVTSYQEALVLKLFTFNFINSYGSLFYLSYFRNITFPNGLFGLGSQYTDSCANNNCMSLLSVQVLILLILQPMPRLFFTIIYPAIVQRGKKKEIDQMITAYDQNSQLYMPETKNEEFDKEKAVLMYLSIEKSKMDPYETIIDEFTEKVVLYGYLIIFSVSFSLGPLLVILAYFLDPRIDGKRLLWRYRRPVGLKAQDIGSWYNILRFLTLIGIINNGFLLAFTSNWSVTFFSSASYRFAFAIGFEHFFLIVWFLIIFLAPEVPEKIKEKMKQDGEIIKKVIKQAKNKEDAKLEEVPAVEEENEIDNESFNGQEDENITNIIVNRFQTDSNSRTNLAISPVETTNNEAK